MPRYALVLFMIAVVAVPLTGCQSSNTGSWVGAGVGAAAGAVAGALIADSDSTLEGAAIGAAIGGLAGYIVGTELGSTSDEAAKTGTNYDEARRLFDQANRESDPQRAINLYQQSIDLDGRFPEPHNNMGLRYVQLNRRDVAKTCFERALAVDASYQPARDNLQKLQYGAL